MTLEQARARPDVLALAVIVHGHKRGSLGLSRMALWVARELLASGEERSMVLADLIVGAVREEVRTMVDAEMEAETGWGKTFYFSEIGKAIADGWAAGRRLGQTAGEALGRAKGRAEGRAKGRAEGRAEGRAKGVAKALRTVLAARKLRLDAEQRARIAACRDAKQLERWLRRAVQANDVSEIFA